MLGTVAFAALAALVVLLTAGCAPPTKTQEFVDVAPGLSFGGRDYAGIWGGLFDIDRDSLIRVGEADRINLPASDGAVYRFPDIGPAQVLIAFADRMPTVFVPSQLVRANAPPLGRAIPQLCRYFVELPYECGGRP